MGKARSRTEGPLKVTGRAKYTYDIKLPGMLYGRMIGASVPAPRSSRWTRRRPRRCPA
jgi:xanthine dehydrogenase YagR molybdenum-binding subunit